MSDAVDQLLFGYRDGHELIGASCRLWPEHLREVMQHVDAAVERPDERQLVGTWLPPLGAYLLARIWAAPERPRPGAVWAHVLLISGAQLDQGRTASLLGLLRRPAGEEFGGYAQRLDWPAPREQATVPERLAHALVSATYAGDGRQRIVLWQTPAQAEGALLYLLDTAPRALRRELSFRTRERARRTAAPYRLQVAASLGGRAGEESPLVIDARPAIEDSAAG